MRRLPPRVLVLLPGSHQRVTPLIQGIADTLRGGSWLVETVSSDHPDVAARLNSPRFDAILATTTVAPLDALLQETNTPVVVAFGIENNRTGFPVVDVDDVAVGRLAAEHLAEHGFRSFGYCGHECFWSRRREAGFCHEVGRLGCEVSVIGGSRRLSWSGLERRHVIDRWIRKLPRPIGILACNDLIGIAVQDAVLRAGQGVPRDVAVIGVDNDPLHCTIAPVEQSSVDVNFYEIGREAARLVAAVHAGEAVSVEPVLVPPLGVLARASTERFIFEDADLNEAIRFIRQHAHEGIHLEDVLHRVHLSRSKLHALFRTHLDTSPGRYLRRHQLQRACDRLVHTNHSLTSISLECGFSSMSYFSQAFRAAHGTSPSAYRKKQFAHRRGQMQQR